MKKFKEALARYRRKLRRRKAERNRQIAEYKKTHAVGNAKQAHKRARQTRWLRHLVLKTGRAVRRIALNHREGVDFYGSGPSAAELKGAGRDFVVVYLGVATRDEIDAYAAGGVDVAFVYERDNEAFLRGYGEGEQYARTARYHADQLGLPKSQVIYFAADFNVMDSQLDSCMSFVAGAQHVLGAGAVGVYAGLNLIEHAAQHGVAYLWQTYAWSNHVWCPAAHLRQYLIDLPENPLSIGGHPVDYDKSTKADFGQWKAAPQPPHHHRHPSHPPHHRGHHQH